MGIKTSYSQNSCFTKCSKHWFLKYREGYEGTIEGASTFFGSAIDEAVTVMLMNGTDWLKKFEEKWTFQANYGKYTRIFDNENIMYTNKDFDGELLQQPEFDQLNKWALELGQGDGLATNEMLIALVKQCQKAKSSPYIKVTADQLKFLNRACWLSLKVKGTILLGAFKDQFMPKVVRVISTQSREKIEDPNTGDSIVGVVDMIIEHSDYPGKAIIFDLKTSSQFYEQEKIDVSPQLTLYTAMVGQKYNTDLVGYVVLSKNIDKEIVGTCKVCGANKTTRHETCNAIISGKRCSGEWDSKIVARPVVQVMVESKTQAQIDDLLNDSANIITAMKNDIIFKNTEACTNWFGADCIYKKLCHGGDASGLVKKK